ncbi:MAG: triple tyrosine motif-containing protein [Flavobacteriales bacterium]
MRSIINTTTNSWHFLSLILVFLSLCFDGTAQSDKPFVKRIMRAQGLSQDVCRSVIKDSDGFIWVTTQNGLNRYDGHHSIVFKNNPGDSTSIYGNDVMALCEDGKRNIWISGANFLSRYSMDEHRFYNYSIKLKNPTSYNGFYVKRFFLDRDQRLWLCTIKSGLVLYKPESDDFEYFLPDNEVQNAGINTISDMAQDKQGNYWASSNMGLLQFDPRQKKFSQIQSNGDTGGNRTSSGSISLFVGDSNMVWYGTWGEGLHSYNSGNGKTEVFKYSENLPFNISNIVFAIAQRDAHSLWLCTEKGLMSFDLGSHSFQLIQHETDNPNSLWGGELQNIYIDNEGLLWFAGNHGIEIIDPLQQRFKALPADKSPGIYNLQWNIHTKSIVGTSLYYNRSLWMINPLTGQSNQYPIPEADETMRETGGLYNLKDGHILIGMIRKNPFIFNTDTRKFDQIKLTNLLGVDENMLDIRSAVQDKAGNVWMSNRKGGIVLWKPFENSAKIFGSHEERISGEVNLVTHDVLISGTDIFGFAPTVGFMRISAEDERTVFLPFTNDILKRALHAVCDSDGHFWLTTPSYGLVECTVSDSLRIVNIYRDNLPDTDIDGVYIDDDDCLWINGASGLICFDIKTKTAQLYNEKDGLYPYTSDFTLTQGPDDQFFYLTTNGVGVFSKKDLMQPAKYYRTVLSEFFSDDLPLFPESELYKISSILLQPNQNDISFSFSALCHSGSEKLEFAYKLQGFDEDWHFIGRNHNGGYTNLPHGKYTLFLNSKYSGTPWPDNFTRIEIVLKPHYYQTWWFRGLIMALAVALIIVVIRTHFQNKLRQANLELEKQKSIQNIRTRISRDIHDEIGAGLTKISLLSKQAEKSLGNQEPVNDQIRRINSASRQLVQNLGEIVWTINPNNDTLMDLLSYLRRYVNEMAESSGILFTIQLPEINPEIQSVNVHPEVKRNLLLIIKESLNNAMKHSAASKIDVNLVYSKGVLSTTLTDNGKGFVLNENETVGNGLRNMRKRAEDIGSKLEITTNQQQGTSVHLDIRL